MALDPASAAAHQNLGWALQHDLVGRRFEKGFDLEGALASYKKAKELDPENLVIRGDLAILLEHDAAGHRYGRRANLAQAIEEYRALLKLPDAGGLQDNLLIACLRAGRFEVLKEFLAENVPPEESRWPLDIAVRTVVRGAPQAVEQAQRAIADPRKRTVALAQAGIVLVRSRLYAQAAELYTAAARGGQNSAQLLAQAHQIASTKRWDELKIDRNSPRGAVDQLVLIMMGATELDQIYSVMSRYHERRSKDAEANLELRRSRRQISAQMAKLELDTEIIADLTLSSQQDSIDGDDQNGYLVKRKLSGQSMEFIVVKDGPEYRVLDTVGSSSSTVGYEVIERVRQGHLSEARRLLDWVRDETGSAGGDDPLAGPVLPRFWQKGQQGSAVEIRQAAAALLASEKDSAADSIPLLKVELETAAEAGLRERLQLALASAYALTGQSEELLDTATALAASRPTSDRAFSMIGLALIKLGRWEALETHAAARLKKDARDPQALRLQLESAVGQVNLQLGRRQEDLLRQSGKLQASDFNELAWLALLAGAVDQRALDAVQQGILQSQSNPTATLLHTAASLYAETGKSVEAREVLLQSIALRGDDEPDPASWYVFGRIAENYGEVGAARDMYGRVTRPKDELAVPSSTYALAQRRLAALKGPN